MRKGFSLLELLVVLGFLGILAAMTVPSWNPLLQSHSLRSGESQVIGFAEHARSEAISSGREVWVVFRHDTGKGRDAERMLAREGGKILTLGGWEPLPRGVVFREGSGAVPDAHPPPEIRDAAGASQPANDHLGALMFLRSGTVGWPKPGTENLSIPLDSKAGTSLIRLSRGTGRAIIYPTQGGVQ